MFSIFAPFVPTLLRFRLFLVRLQVMVCRLPGDPGFDTHERWSIASGEFRNDPQARLIFSVPGSITHEN